MEDNDNDSAEKIYTLLVDVCSGKNPNELIIAGIIHPEGFPLEMNSALIRMDISDPQPECHTLVHAVNGIEKDGNQSYFNCINDNEILYLGDFNGCIKYDKGNIDRLIFFDNLTPSPGFIQSFHFTDRGHIVYGTFNGIIINSENEILKSTRVFEDRDRGNSVDGIHGIGKSFLVAVIRMGN